MEATTRTAWTSETGGEHIAAYETAHGAELAADRLANDGFSPEEIAIRPLTVRPLPGWRERTRRQEHSAVAIVAAIGVAIGIAALAAFVATVETSWGLVMIILVAFVVAVGFGTLTIATASWWATHVRTRAQNDRRLIAQAFEIRCRVDAPRARRLLARWWNPAARPTSPDH